MMPSLAMAALGTVAANGGGTLTAHWSWWAVGAATFLALGWAIGQAVAERRQLHRDVVLEEEAEDVLRRRLARGEVGQEEFILRLRLLHGSRGPQPAATGRPSAR